MIRLIDGEIVRQRSFAFPVADRLPRVARSLPRRLGRKPPSYALGAGDLVTLRYNFQSRVASVHTSIGEVAWHAAVPCQLQVHFCDGLLRPNRELRPVVQTGLAKPPAAVGEPDGRTLTQSRRGPGESEPGPGSPVARLLEEEPHSNAVLRNGQYETNGAHVNGQVAGQAGSGYVRLALMEERTAKLYVVLHADTYSLSLLGRYRLLAETLAKWTGASTAVVSGH